jgi:uncharacterized iron-regulated membrane protein
MSLLELAGYVLLVILGLFVLCFLLTACIMWLIGRPSKEELENYRCLQEMLSRKRKH